MSLVVQILLEIFMYIFMSDLYQLYLKKNEKKEIVYQLQ